MTTIPTALDALTAVKAAMADSSVTPERIIKLMSEITRKNRRGRKTPDLLSFTFPLSGYTVRVRQLGPWTLDQIRQGVAKIRQAPPVPIVDVEDGEYPDGRIRYRKEANPADPDYQAAVRDYEEWLAETAGFRLLEVIISSCVVPDPEDIDPDEVTAHRRALLIAGPQDGDLGAAHRAMIDAMPDEEVFVRCMCLTGREDVTDLQNFVANRSMPTASEVAAQIETFPSDVQGQADL